RSRLPSSTVPTPPQCNRGRPPPDTGQRTVPARHSPPRRIRNIREILPQRTSSRETTQQPDLPRVQHFVLAAPVQTGQPGRGQRVRPNRRLIQVSLRDLRQLAQQLLMHPVEHPPNLFRGRIPRRVGDRHRFLAKQLQKWRRNQRFVFL